MCFFEVLFREFLKIDFIRIRSISVDQNRPNFEIICFYTEATLKFLKLNTQAQQREAVVQGRSLSPYRRRYSNF
ncbi:MAG: hypothetical protein LBJ00_12945 [Planctomycetaceae bacterium]|nr:hypothetical protein [Planctomycetaceae bacterium]